MERTETIRRQVYGYLVANEGASRDEITATLKADPEGFADLSETDVHRALSDMEAEGVVFQLSTGTIGGDRYAVV
jgi:DNA-binding PadR family transcriptional regulator